MGFTAEVACFHQLKPDFSGQLPSCLLSFLARNLSMLPTGSCMAHNGMGGDEMRDRTISNITEVMKHCTNNITTNGNNNRLRMFVS
jgi:hypothetical protein